MTETTIAEHASEFGEREPTTLPGAYTRVVLDSGESWTVRVTNRDFIAWDKSSAPKRYGAAKDCPFVFATFLAWSASRRAGHFDGSFDAGPESFMECATDVDPTEAPVSPTAPAHVAG